MAAESKVQITIEAVNKAKGEFSKVQADLKGIRDEANKAADSLKKVIDQAAKAAAASKNAAKQDPAAGAKKDAPGQAGAAKPAASNSDKDKAKTGADAKESGDASKTGGKKDVWETVGGNLSTGFESGFNNILQNGVRDIKTAVSSVTQGINKSIALIASNSVVFGNVEGKLIPGSGAAGLAVSGFSSEKTADKEKSGEKKSGEGEGKKDSEGEGKKDAPAKADDKEKDKAAKEAGEASTKAAKEAKATWDSVGGYLSTGFQDGFFSLLQNGFKDLKSGFQGFLDSVTKGINQSMALILKNLVVYGNAEGKSDTGGGVLGLFKGIISKLGGSPETPYPELPGAGLDDWFSLPWADSSWASATEEIFHGGGIAGREGRKYWQVVPRFHGGAGPDEIDAVLKKGEGVFTPGQMTALGLMANKGAGGGSPVNVEINVQNNTGSQVKARESGMNFDGKKWVKGIILELAETDMTFRRTMGATR